MYSFSSHHPTLLGGKLLLYEAHTYGNGELCTMFLRASTYIHSLEFFCIGVLPPPHLFIYTVVYLCQHGLIDIYFIVYFII